jgi:D-3-phosphoglycerate dehydrogenase
MSVIVITDSNLPTQGEEDRLLEAAGHSVVRLQCTSEDEVVAGASEAEGLIVQWAPIGERTFAALPDLKIVSRLGIGVDMVDLDAASRHGVAVANTPEYCVEEVALHTLALLLSAMRGLPQLDRDVRAGTWAPVASYPGARRPSATTVAVIGYGRIGRRVASACAAMGFAVLVVDPVATLERDSGARLVELDEALAGADAISLHAPLTADTRHLIDASALARVRRGAVLVNTCRGPLVDERALAEALADGTLGAAALDVFEQEPLADDSPLRSLPNVLLTPHSAWYSPESLAELPLDAARNIIRFLAGEPVSSVTNPAYADAGAGR